MIAPNLKRAMLVLFCILYHIVERIETRVSWPYCKRQNRLLTVVCLRQVRTLSCMETCPKCHLIQNLPEQCHSIHRHHVCIDTCVATDVTQHRFCNVDMLPVYHFSRPFLIQEYTAIWDEENTFYKTLDEMLASRNSMCETLKVSFVYIPHQVSNSHLLEVFRHNKHFQTIIRQH